MFIQKKIRSYIKSKSSVNIKEVLKIEKPSSFQIINLSQSKLIKRSMFKSSNYPIKDLFSNNSNNFNSKNNNHNINQYISYLLTFKDHNDNENYYNSEKLISLFENQIVKLKKITKILYNEIS